MSHAKTTIAVKPDALDTSTIGNAAERTEFGFARTTCACSICIENCKHIPGYLIPDDVERIGRHLGYTNIGEFAFDYLLASPGATVMHGGRIFQIPTLVPKRKEDGCCVFLEGDNRCRIHAVAPFGCSFFDHAQPDEEAQRRSSRGLQEIAKHWAAATRNSYTVLWRLLYAASRRAIPPHIARARMRDARQK